MSRHQVVERSVLAIAAIGLCTAGIVINSARAQPIPPVTWELRQNEPNPFCPEDDGSARITMILERAAHVELSVWQSDSTAVLRTLVTTDVPGAGMLSVWWDGRDANGALVPNGRYPYTFRATDGAATLLFEASRAATVRCTTGVESSRWERIKRFYR